jgi:hypothetical protein
LPDRQVWAKTVYGFGVLYFELAIDLHGRK